MKNHSIKKLSLFDILLNSFSLFNISEYSFLSMNLPLELSSLKYLSINAEKTICISSPSSGFRSESISDSKSPYML